MHEVYEFVLVDPKSILVPRDDRQRREVKVDDLLTSIKNVGILQPLVVQAGQGGIGWTLVAGERRLTAALELGLAQVPVRTLASLSPIEAQILELEENVKRRDLTWQEHALATKRIHDLFRAEDPEWTQWRTGEAIGLEQGTISNFLRVAQALDEPVIAQCSSLREAYNILKRREDRLAGDALEELLGAGEEVLPPSTVAGAYAPERALDGGTTGATPTGGPTPAAAPTPPPAPPGARIIHADFLEWLREPLAGPKFNFIHCDFPYGLNVFSSEQMRGERHGEYDDDPEVYWALIRALCGALPRIASLSCHVMFWFSEKHRDATLALFRDLAPQLRWHPFPLIWHKTDNAGIAGDSQRHHRHVYETALIGSIGQRPLIRTASDCYGAPTAKLLHASTKPEPMLRHFLATMVGRDSRVLDPTCGSGASIRAADSLGCEMALGIEKDPEYAKRAQGALRQAQNLRASGL